MISVLVNWAYVFATTYILGHFVLNRAYAFYNHNREVRWFSSVAAGLAVTTVYAGFFSVFSRVAIAANLIMIVACAICAYLEREHYKQVNILGTGTIVLTNYVNIIKLVVIVVVFAAALFYTTEGQFFSDSGYYHEQSIRWIEEFGTVKGSIHVLKRLAYNSSYFCQCALYSMKDLWGQSLHCLGGFYSIFLMVYGILGMKKGQLKINVLRVAPVIYFILFCSEITSPASDFPLVYSVIFVAIRWFEIYEEDKKTKADGGKTENGYAPYALLSMFVVFIISIKLTVGCLVFIVLMPAIEMIREKKVKEIIASVIAGIVIVLPYFIRNYLICGWLIYPFTAIDIFNPIWKIAKDAAQADADEIKIWGRGMGQLGGTVNDSISTWLPHWWEYMSEPNRRIILSFILIAACYLAYRACRVVVFLVKAIKEKTVNKMGGTNENTTENGLHKLGITATQICLHKITFELALVLSLAMWFLESPLFRYGIAYILVGGCYMIGDALEKLFYVNKVFGFVSILICVCLLLPAVKSTKEYISWDKECILYGSDFTYFVKQEDYPRVPYVTKEMDGVTFYCPEEDMGQIGYHIFPAIWHMGTEGVTLIGDELKDGVYFYESGQ